MKQPTKRKPIMDNEPTAIQKKKDYRLQQARTKD